MKQIFSAECSSQRWIAEGNTTLGIELGSTRIKAVLIGPDYAPLASGGFDWQNRFENGVWSYHLDDVWQGLQTSFSGLSAQVLERYGVPLTTTGALGISAMMHGYLAFDEYGEQLVPFRTWRNVITEQAAALLTEEFQFNIPQRWSIAHLYQAMLNREPHVNSINFLTTLAGYVHWRLTGEQVLGVGDASGVFPINSETGDYDDGRIRQFEALAAKNGFSQPLRSLLPRVLRAGEPAGTLTPEGARMLDPSGRLLPGIPLCPPEGDAGTGMTATNSVAEKTGNISAGTSIFAMIVLERPLSRVYPEIDMVTTPSGKPTAMVHCNSCTSDLDAWVRVLSQALMALGIQKSKPELYDAFYYEALKGAPDCAGLLSYNYYSGEPITGLEEGRPLFVRTPGSELTYANFARTLLYSTVATLKIGMDLLTAERVSVTTLLGHGGLFKTKGVGQALMASALHTPVAVMETAGEGGAWGIALLAAYLREKRDGQPLKDYLARQVFASIESESIRPNPEDEAGFTAFMKRYREGLAIERAAVQHLK
ncbi:xylulokinase [Faecalispora anaeroviscerum]|uniref:xylulokinase n=1 Tax=Faecalispora anaeroviscerum TaxID=2991836 RepID=UPI0024BB3207|nr:FGGY-family carbohydrate kinase [Faecalispora anaeroviscerum]